MIRKRLTMHCSDPGHRAPVAIHATHATSFNGLLCPSLLRLPLLGSLSNAGPQRLDRRIRDRGD